MQSHLAKLNDDYSRITSKVESLEMNMAEVKTDVGWLKSYLPPLTVAAVIASGIITYLVK